MDLPGLRLLLLKLTGTAGSPALGDLAAEDWAVLARMAAQHRLEPLLHARHRDHPSLPSAIAGAWHDAQRRAGMMAMAQQADLRQTVALLDRAGFEPIALKGAWLAWHAYPQPALRPLRDLDLLLDPGAVIDALTLLEGAGYRREPGEMQLEDCLRLDKHLPPLVTPRGTLIELHHRLWERGGRLDHSLPAAADCEVRTRAERGDDGILYPAPDDMFAHLVIHGLYSHRLDCGPLLLADIAALSAARRLDWDYLWHRAETEGWRHGMRLVLDLVARCHPEAPIVLQGSPTDRATLDVAAQLLLQDLDTRHSAGFAAAALKARPGAILRRLRGVNAAIDAEPVQRDLSGGRLAWASDRLRRTFRDLTSADTRAQAGNLATLSRWLDR